MNNNALDECTLTDAELVEKARDWISRLAKTGGREWCLRVPVDFNHDPDMIFSELCNRLEGAKTTEQQVQPVNGGMCTRPDMVDCHAKVGTGGRCMNVVPCPPLQVN